jgi:hypothetical protein
VVLAVYYGFIVSHGTLHFVGHEPGSRIYSAMWRSLVEGRFDLDPADVGVEAFHRGDKTYTYYGIFPAFIRGIASVFTNPGRGGLAQLSCVLAMLVFVGGFLWAGLQLGLHRLPARPRFLLFMATLAVATPMVVCLALADIYDEAVLWGAAWAGLCNASLILFAELPPGTPAWNRALVVSVASAGLALLSRATSGCFSGLEVGLVAMWLGVDRRDPPASAATPSPSRRTVVIAGALYLLLAGFQGCINAERWGNPFEFRPIQLQQAFDGTDRGRLEASHGLFNAQRVATSACFYLLPDPSNLQRHWPFLSLGPQRCFGADADALAAMDWHVEGPALRNRSTPYYDLIDGAGLSLTMTSPALLLFALLGVWRTRFLTPPAWRDRVGIALSAGAVACAAFFLTLDTLASRYAADFVPALAGLGFIGTLPATESAPTGRRRLAPLALAALVLVSAYATTMDMLLTKASRPGVPAQRREAVRAFLNG